MPDFSIEFSDYGGYDSLTGAWTIYSDGKILLEVDQRHFGQDRGDYEFYSSECANLAGVVYEAVKKFYKAE